MKKTKMTIEQNLTVIRDFLVENEASEELVEFIEKRLELDVKAKERRANKRTQIAGEKKDASQSEFYVGLAKILEGVLTKEPQTGGEMLEQIDELTPNGKEYLPVQIATALKPRIESGEVIKGRKKVVYINSKGLRQESLRVSYQLA